MASDHVLIRRPRVSRETRRLLAAAVIAFLALSVLARIRFPDRPPTPNPVAPVFTQLLPRPGFADLASELAQLRQRIDPFLTQIETASRLSGTYTSRTALRVGARSVAVLSSGDMVRPDEVLIAHDRATGLALLRGTATPVEPRPWNPDRVDEPAFLVSAVRSQEGILLQPLYIASMQTATDGVLWPGPIWTVPAEVTLSPGTFMFSTDGELVGVAIERSGAAAIVPAPTLLNAVRMLQAAPLAPTGWLGIEVQPITDDLVAAVARSEGLVVTWIDPSSPAIRDVKVGDVIEALNDSDVSSPNRWSAVVNRMSAGDTVSIRLARSGTTHHVTLTVASAPSDESSEPGALGLTLRRVRAGSEVVAVDPGSVGASAGMSGGDVIHMAGGVAAPTPAQIRAAFQTSDPGRPLLIGVTRGDTHRVVVLRK
jgi:PDZ domain-containing protein